jgi:LysM repeat protein
LNRKTACSAAFLAGAVLIGIGPATAQEASSPPAPPADAPGAVPPYTVAAGDSLSHISDARLGTSDRWLEIFVINRDLIQDPNQIEVGQILQIRPLRSPSPPTSSPPRRPATPIRWAALIPERPRRHPGPPPQVAEAELATWPASGDASPVATTGP